MLKFTAILASCLAILLASLMPPNAKAQDTQLWTALLANGDVKEGEPLLLWFDGHARYSDDVGRLGVSIIRPGLGWRVNDKLSLWVGYAHVISRADGRANIVDHRIWQQATYPIASGEWGNLSGRTRLEQRFLNTGTETAHRLRQFVRYTKPITGSKWTVAAWNEIFIGLNDTNAGPQAGYDQNRTFVGLNRRLSSRVSLEGGYLYNNIGRVGPNASNHNVSLSISVGL